MKDAEEPQRVVYDLNTIESFTDDGNEIVTSLIQCDRAREPIDGDPRLIKVPRLTQNHKTLWESICARTEETKNQTRGDLRAKDIDMSKKFG